MITLVYKDKEIQMPPVKAINFNVFLKMNEASKAGIKLKTLKDDKDVLEKEKDRLRDERDAVEDTNSKEYEAAKARVDKATSHFEKVNDEHNKFAQEYLDLQIDVIMTIKKVYPTYSDFSEEFSMFEHMKAINGLSYSGGRVNIEEAEDFLPELSN